MHTHSKLLMGLILAAGLVGQGLAAEPFREVGGLLVFEAEHFAGSDKRTDPANGQWSIATTRAGFVGDRYVVTPPAPDNNGTWANGCELSYEINFTTGGTYTLWHRRFAADSGTNSVWVGLDGVQIGNTNNNNADPMGVWVWLKLDGTVTVTPGKHVFQLRRREGGYISDRILMTTNGAYTPTGDGPAESPRTAPAKATEPYPKDKAADVSRDTVLSWKSGLFAATHNIYLGTAPADVSAASPAKPLGVLTGQVPDANTFDPTRLEFGQTYYWRVDEVNAPPTSATVFTGDVWSFTVEPAVYPVKNILATASSSFDATTGPERTIDGSGLNAAEGHSTVTGTMWLTNTAPPVWIQYQFDDVYQLQEMWVWNSNQMIESFAGLGAKDVTVEYSTDGVAWTTLPGVPQFARASGADDYPHNTTVNFAGAAAKYVKLTIRSTWGGVLPQAGLSEVRFFHTPVQAREPQPTTAQTEVTPETTLAWRSGREAASHNVYLGTDPNALILAGTTTQSSFVPGSLNLGTTYYWRIDEVNAVETPSLWTGKVWSFSTRVYSVVDDMESYTDETGKAIFDAWLDGFTVAENGAQVGYDKSPFAEKLIFHGGKQSMPLRYDNTSPVNYSEAELTWTAAQDWTRNSADTLSLWFRGILPGFLAVTPDHVVMNGMGKDIGGTADQGRFVYKQLTGNGTIIARLDRMIATNGQAKASVMIRQSLQPNSAWAHSVFTPGYGCYFVIRPTTGAASASDLAVATAAQTAVRGSVWLKVERVGNQFNAYYATSAAPTTWIPSPLKPQTIAMTDPVYIGLAVTSFVATGVAQAEFSSIATTGNVTGNWQSADLDIAQPAGNTLDTFYVTVKDSAGKSTTLKHADALAVGMDQWQQWQIPFSALTGVNAAKIKTLFLGVGDRTAPQHGAGTLYIDDIAVGRPTP